MTSFSGGTINGNILPSATGNDLGAQGTQEWDAFLQNANISGTLSAALAKNIGGVRVYSSTAYASFQAAINDTPSGGILFIPSGTNINAQNLAINFPITIIGANRNGVTLQSTGSLMFSPGGAAIGNIEFHNITFEGNNQIGSKVILFPDSSVNLYFSQGRYTFNDCVFQNFSSSTSYAISVSKSCYLFDIQRCIFKNNTQSISFGKDSEYQVKDCAFWNVPTSNATNQVELDGSSVGIIEGCDFENDNSVAATIADIAIKVPASTSTGYCWIKDNKFGSEGETSSRYKIWVNGGSGSNTQGIRISGNNFGMASGQTAIQLDTHITNSFITDNNFLVTGTGTCVNDNQGIISETYNSGNTFSGNRIYTDPSTQGTVTVFTNGGRNFDYIENPIGSVDREIRWRPLHSESPALCNRVTNSESPLTNWTLNSVTLTTGVTDPFGGTGAVTMTRGTNGGGDNIQINPSTSGMGSTWVVSFWAKSGTASNLSFTIYDNTASAFHAFKTIYTTTNWERFQATFSGLNSASTLRLIIYPEYAGTLGDTISIFGIQVSDWNSDYLKTTGTAVTSNTSFSSRFSNGLISAGGIEGDVIAGTNVAGTDLALRGGRGTGTGLGGKVNLQIAPTGSSGATANTPATAHTFDYRAYTQTEPANGATFGIQSISELITLSTSGTTTDSSTNLLPANSLLLGVVAYVQTTITTATSWQLGDGTTAGRFTAANATMTAGTTDIGKVHLTTGVASATTGFWQASAAKLRITTVGTPGSGKIRITVFYIPLTPPVS